MLSAHGDVIGMTGGTEASLAAEAGMKYAMFALVDNWANGFEPEKLTLDAFKAAQALHLNVVETAVKAVLGHLAAGGDAATRLALGAGDEEARVPVDHLVHARYVVPVEPHGVVEILRHGCRKTIAPEAVGVEGAPVLVELFVPEPPHEGWPDAGAAGRRLKPRTSAAEPCAPQGRASRLRAPCRLAEGAPPGTPLLSFHNFYLSQPTHTACFLKAGFADPERHRLEISPEGLDRAPAGFWDGMLANGPVYYRAESVVPYGFQPAFWPRVPRYDRHGELVPGTSPREKREE